MKKNIDTKRIIRCMLYYDSKIELAPIRSDQVEQVRLSLLKSTSEEVSLIQCQQPMFSYKMNVVEDNHDDLPDIIQLNPEAEKHPAFKMPKKYPTTRNIFKHDDE